MEDLSLCTSKKELKKFAKTHGYTLEGKTKKAMRKELEKFIKNKGKIVKEVPVVEVEEEPVVEVEEEPVVEVEEEPEVEVEEEPVVEVEEEPEVEVEEEGAELIIENEPTTTPCTEEENGDRMVQLNTFKRGNVLELTIDLDDLTGLSNKMERIGVLEKTVVLLTNELDKLKEEHNKQTVELNKLREEYENKMKGLKLLLG